MRILLIHTDSEVISGKEFRFVSGDILVLCIKGWLRFLINLAGVESSSWLDWKCIEQVVQTEYLPKKNAILLDSDGMSARKCDISSLKTLNTMFKDEVIKEFLNNVLSYASFKEERLNIACLKALVETSAITPSKERVYPSKPIVEPIIKVDEGATRPKTVDITPEIKAQKMELKEFLCSNVFGHLFPDDDIKVEVYFNSEAFSLCEKYQIAYPKDYLVLVVGNGIAQKQDFLESFLVKKVKVLNDNLLYWEELKYI